MKFVAVAIIAAATVASPVLAKDVIVQMKTSGKGGMMVFEPSFIKAQPGDVIHFVPTDMSHNAETIPTMLPAGVAPSKGGMNKEFVLPVTTPGIYGIKCRPHFPMGMVAVVQVGNGPSANLAAAKAIAMPGLAGKRMAAALAMAK